MLTTILVSDPIALLELFAVITTLLCMIRVALFSSEDLIIHTKRMHQRRVFVLSSLFDVGKTLSSKGSVIKYNF